jgi:hypothetical protein
MNNPSLNKFESRVAAGGTIISDSTLVTDPINRGDVNSIAVPASAIATKTA